MGWVDGKPKMVSERYVGTAADIEALLEAREERMVPERTRHLDFGAVAAAWGLLADLGVAAVIDEEIGAAAAGAAAVTGHVPGAGRAEPAGRIRAPSGRSRTGGGPPPRTGSPGSRASALDHRRFWDAMHAVPLEALARIEEKLAAAACARFGLDYRSVALDMTNFATFIDTATARRRSRSGARPSRNAPTCGWSASGLVVTRDGGVPLLSHAYPGNKPDVTQFPQMIRALAARHAALPPRPGSDGAEMTVVFDAGQNSEANFALPGRHEPALRRLGARQ